MHSLAMPPFGVRFQVMAVVVYRNLVDVSQPVLQLCEPVVRPLTFPRTKVCTKQPHTKGDYGGKAAQPRMPKLLPSAQR